MFDLEKALASWRRQFAYTRTVSPADLDEMERHLRDQIADLVAAGETPKAAFREAVAEMGGLVDAESEFGKVYWQKVRHQRTVLRELGARWAMLRNYVKLAYRTLLRNKAPSVINIVGLSIALACCVVVYIFLAAWHSMDSYHENGDRIFLAQHDVEREYQVETWGRMPMPLGPAMANDFPQVERTVRVNWNQATVQHGDQALDELIMFVDGGFFEMLTFPLKYGSPDALADPNTVILSDRIARKYFGDSNPVGETLTLTFGRQYREAVTVGGVTEAFPSNTGFRFGFLMGFDRQRDLGLADLNDWSVMTSGLFVEVKEPEDIETITAQMDRYVAVQNAANTDWPIRSFAFDNFADPAPDAYLVRGRIAESAHPALSIMFIATALFMLALSCFNYINIALGSAAQRLKEIGMRKVIGGNKRQLVLQFMTENILLCLFALALGIVLAKVFLIPLFNSIFVFFQLDLTFADNLGLWAFLAGLLLFVGVASGAYPALYVASFQPITIFRGRQKLADNAWFTKAFLTFQFVLAFITVILSVVLTMNSRYAIQQDWGYNPAHTLIVELQEQSRYTLLRDALAQHPDIVSLAGTVNHIGRSSSEAVQQNPDGGTQTVMRYYVGPHYLQTMGLRLQAGRFFDAALASDATEAVVVNERFVQAQGWTEALGQSVRLDSTLYTVIGVVEDFTYFFLIEPQPAAFLASNGPSYNYLALHLRDDAGDEVKAFVEATWARLFPEAVLTQFYQKAVFDESYRQYNNVVQAFSYIAALALLIACMGLFGLASQNIARRMKEVNIRKVVGASVSHLAFLVNRGFLGQLALAATLATALCVIGLSVLMSVVRAHVPLAHMPLTPVPFTLAYVLVFATAALAVGAQIYKLIDANPADVLRSE